MNWTLREETEKEVVGPLLSSGSPKLLLFLHSPLQLGREDRGAGKP